MPDDVDFLLQSAKVRARYDNVSPMTIHRWRNDPELDFPPPIKIRNRNYWWLSQIVEWERRQAAASARSRRNKSESKPSDTEGVHHER